MKLDLLNGQAHWQGLACALFATIAASGAAAQSPYSLDPVLVSAARIEQRAADALPAVTVITRDDIERLQPTQLVELLGRQAGVEFARAGGPGSQASIFLRGANSSQTLVLLDGVRLNTALSGAAVLDAIHVDAIERIEIVRGNLSSLYGSEAIGGVIQIFTRSGRRSGIDAHAEIGAGESRAGSLHWAQRFESGTIALSAAGRRSAPFSAIDASQVTPGPFAAGANPDIDGSRNRSVALRGSAKLGAVDVDAGVWGNRSDTDFDSTADGPFATHEERSRQRAVHASARAELATGWQTRLALAQASDDTRNRSSEPFSFNSGEFEARNRSLTLANELRIGERVVATLVYEHLRQRGASTSYDPDFGGVLTPFSRRVNSVQAGAVASADRHRLQANLRHDEYSDAGGATTGLLAYGYELSPHWRASAQVASSFRAPSFNDLHFPFFGNRDLSPERSRGGELALRYRARDTLLRLSVYRNRTRNLIVFDPASSQARNIAQADADGIELAGTAHWYGWRLQADATVLRARDRATGERLLRRAPHTLHLSAARNFERWDGSFEISRSGARVDADINTFARKRLAPYTLARTVLSWRATQAVRLHLRAENLFDADYALVDGYNTPRRSLFVGLTAKL